MATVPTIGHTPIMVRTTMTLTTILITTLLLPTTGRASASRLGSKL